MLEPAIMLENAMGTILGTAEVEHDLQAGNLRCQVCDTPVPGAICGRKEPCPGCGFFYPLGDCSDLAEN